MARLFVVLLVLVGLSSCNCGTGETSDGGVDAGVDGGADAGVVDAGTDAGLAALCAATGGSVSMGACCLGTGDFPNLCLTGACGCAPSSSHDVQVCACGAGCFDPAVGCVSADAGVDDGGTDGGDDALCTGTNGSVVDMLCCAATGDFPNLCAVGACSCAPANSHMVRTCACTGGQCYEPGLGCH